MSENEQLFVPEKPPTIPAELAVCIKKISELINTSQSEDVGNWIILSDWLKYLQFLSTSKDHFNTKTLELIQLCTAMIVEIGTVDNISCEPITKSESIQNTAIFASRYGRGDNREFVFGNTRFTSSQVLPRNEALTVLSTLATQEKLREIRSVEELLSSTYTNKTDVIITQPIQSLSQYEELRTYFRPYSLDKPLKPNKRPRKIFCAVQLTNQISVIVCFSGYSAPFSVSNLIQRNFLEYKISSLPTITILEALIRSEVNLTKEKSPLRTDGGERERREELSETTIEDTHDPIRAMMEIMRNFNGLESWQKGSIYKRALQLERYLGKSSSTGEIDVQEIERRQTEYYESLLSQQDKNVEVLITRSGLSANTIALMAAQKIFADRSANPIQACFTPGWYYENKPPTDWQHCNPNEADILLIDIEPNEPPLDVDDYRKMIESSIEVFLTNVISKPERNFILVIDKTSNLFSEDLIEAADIPGNLTIIETASLSKHQRGGKYYFYGIVASQNNPLSDQEMRDFRTIATGTPTTHDLISLPRVRKKETQSAIEKNIQMGKMFASAVENAQDEVPSHMRWKVISYNYYCFLVPPNQIIIEHYTSKKIRVNWLNGNLLLDVCKEFLSGFSEESSNFEIGDSFGMNKARITPFPITLPKEVGTTGKFFSCRVSFGRLNTDSDFEIFGSYIGKALKDTYLRDQNS